MMNVPQYPNLEPANGNVGSAGREGQGSGNAGE
jgi:hypothetical protein